MLESLQYSLLRRKEELIPPSTGLWNDSSLQILACPDRGREIEEIREQVLDFIKDNRIAMHNEVVVYLTDPSRHVPYIQRVFGRFKPYDPEYIPFCILGTTGKDTLFAQGMKALLDIMQLRFDRAHVFELLRNPIVQATRGFSADAVSIWEQWAEALSIFRGYNLEQRMEMGDTGLALTDAHTFKLGMARMLVVELTEGAVILDFIENETGNDSSDAKSLPVIPYRDFETSDRKNLEMFCATMEALYSDGKRLRESVETGPDGAVETMRNLVSQWMGKIPETTAVDGAAEGSMLRSLYDGLAAVSLQKSIPGRAHIPFEEFVTLVTGCLPDEGASPANAWTGGITFAPLKPSMVVPHNIIFVAGLDDVLFPGSNERPSWGLLSCKRIIGDSDGVRDSRFAFLELLHAARKRLILTYRSKDMQKESELHPSSVIEELKAYLIDMIKIMEYSDGKQVYAFQREIPWIVHIRSRHYVFGRDVRLCGQTCNSRFLQGCR
ncbi:MAG: exodeoxyribonuclease V subunit gamma, partial [Chitinispirillaceae bacterium]|nr:exodeoxyribonuclease V subunit gamma [Chitinispirillaceae bacterium]